MSYTKQTWQTGDVITAEKLNHIEDGIACGYDIMFTQARMEFTADGASLEELLSGGERKASYVFSSNPNKQYIQSIDFRQMYSSKLEPNSSVEFVFFETTEQRILSMSLSSDGSYGVRFTYLSSGEIENYSGTYTYSNGHYVFTASESGS